MNGIRWLIHSDMPAVLAIEETSFPSPWTEYDFSRQLRQRNSIGIVVDQEKQILAYAIYSLHGFRISVENFAVHPDSRRQGVGSLLCEKLMSKLNNRRTRLFVDVSEFNLGAQLFWRACGFRAIEIERDRFDGADAYRFVRRKQEVRILQTAEAFRGH